jgi:DNA ligase D-like protein (predicted 3'-phosphoesterase)
MNLGRGIDNLLLR